jgi:hypothetical protein
MGNGVSTAPLKDFSKQLTLPQSMYDHDQQLGSPPLTPTPPEHTNIDKALGAVSEPSILPISGSATCVITVSHHQACDFIHLCVLEPLEHALCSQISLSKRCVLIN